MDILSRPVEEFENDQSLETAWAVKAMEHAEIYFNLICSVDPEHLKLTPYDDQIYTAFRHDFPDLDIAVLTDDDLKSTEEKTKWRAFITKFDRIEDFSYGTLLRCNCREEFSPDNVMLVVRVQFLAIEIARNREGCNNDVRQKYAPKAVTESKGVPVE